MPIIQDKEFGKITIRRSIRAKQVRIKVAPDGTLRASMPMYTPIILVKHFIKSSRDELRTILNRAKPAYNYENGMQIGKSHTLIIQPSSSASSSVYLHGQQIILRLSDQNSIRDIDVERQVRDKIIAALKVEAKSYLPKRLTYLAQKFGYQYKNVRFSHASGRWGSCNSNGTISLNIALMKLPFELIDYVLVHELSHTKQMNHSQAFWKLVGACDPDYRLHRNSLKSENPSI